MIDSTRGHPDRRRNHTLLWIACVVVFGCSLVEPWGALALGPALITLALSAGVVYVDARKRRPLAKGIAGLVLSLAAVVVAIVWCEYLLQAGHC
jgi:hypothetical protein